MLRVVLVGLFGLLIAASTAQAKIRFTAVSSGDPTVTSAVLWAAIEPPASSGDVPLTVLISDQAEPSKTVATLATFARADRNFTAHVVTQGLSPGRTYRYRFYGPEGEASEVGRLVTPPADTARRSFRLGFSGDADGRFRPYPVMATIAQEQLDAFVFLGDVIYETASEGSPAAADPELDPVAARADYNRKYRENLAPVTEGGAPGLRDLFRAQPLYVLPDNHELGNKRFAEGGASLRTSSAQPPVAGDVSADVNRTGSFIRQTAGFSALLDAFTDHLPVRDLRVSSPGDTRSDGSRQLYLARRWGACCLYLQIDDRSYRDVRLRTAEGKDDTGLRADNPDRTMLGATQYRWLIDQLRRAAEAGVPWVFLAMSSPMDQTGQDGGKSWIGGYRAERERLLRDIAGLHLPHLVFLSTDDHLVRINEMTYVADPAQPERRTRLGGSLAIVAGPIGAGGPDKFSDHSIAALTSAADSLAESQTKAGIDPIGLAPDYPGLRSMHRAGRATTGSAPEPVDFYSPDTFNYVVLEVPEDGSYLRVKVIGIPSYPAELRPEQRESQKTIELTIGHDASR